MKVFGSGLKSINIVYWAGKENANADALSRNPVGPTPRNAELEGVQVASVQTGELTIQELLTAIALRKHSSLFSLTLPKSRVIYLLSLILFSLILLRAA